MTTITPAAKRACGDWPLLSSEEITAKLPEFTLWTVEADEGIPKLHRQVVCKNFEEALSFVNQCGAIAERYGHHPGM